MALSPRERTIAIVVGAAIGLYALDSFAISPYRDKRKELESQRDAVKILLQKADTMQRRQEHVRRDWNQLNLNGLKTDPAEAESQLSHALLEWIQESGLTYTSSKQERTTQEGKFTQINYRATATGSQAAIAKLLWRIETTPVPIRITDVNINARDEGKDNLLIQLGIATLCATPDADKPDPKTERRTVATVSAGRDRS